MTRAIIFSAIVLSCSFLVSLAHGFERGRGGEGRSEGRQSPGGSWSERSHQGGSGHHSYGQSGSEQERGGQSSKKNESSDRSREGSGKPESGDGASDSNRRGT